MIAERFPPDLGGVARSAARTVQTLIRMGIQTEVFTWTKAVPPGKLQSQELSFDSPVPLSVMVHRLGLFANIDFSLQYTMNVLEWLQQRKSFDLVWGHYLFPAGFMAVLMAERDGIRSTVSARGNDIDRMMFPPGDFGRLIWTLSRADAITAVSRDLAQKIKLLLGNNPRVDLLPNVVEASLFTPGPPDEELRQTLGILPEEVVLGFCGELRQKKGLTFLLQALSEVRAVRPACLLVIGEVRARERALLSTFSAEDPATARRILVTEALDTQDEVVKHLRLCDVFLLPSLWEGMPNALLEAMACERLVLASDAGGIPEVLQHGKNGFLIAKSNLDKLGTATLELLALPPTERHAIGGNARKHIMNHHHSEIEADAMGALLEHLGRLPPPISS